MRVVFARIINRLRHLCLQQRQSILFAIAQCVVGQQDVLQRWRLPHSRAQELMEIGKTFHHRPLGKIHKFVGSHLNKTM